MLSLSNPSPSPPSPNCQVMPAAEVLAVHKGRFLVTSSRSRDTRVPTFPVTASEDVYALGLKRGFYRGLSQF